MKLVWNDYSRQLNKLFVNNNIINFNFSDYFFTIEAMLWTANWKAISVLSRSPEQRRPWSPSEALCKYCERDLNPIIPELHQSLDVCPSNCIYVCVFNTESLCSHGRKTQLNELSALSIPRTPPSDCHRKEELIQILAIVNAKFIHLMNIHSHNIIWSPSCWMESDSPTHSLARSPAHCWPKDHPVWQHPEFICG